MPAGKLAGVTVNTAVPMFTVYGLDGDFSEERLIDRFNADLANDIGNLVSRVLSMAARYFAGAITAAPTSSFTAPGTDGNDGLFSRDR